VRRAALAAGRPVERGRGEQRVGEAHARLLGRDNTLPLCRLQRELAVEGADEQVCRLARGRERDEERARLGRKPLEPTGNEAAQAFG
jgi:hypothetical protein